MNKTSIRRAKAPADTGTSSSAGATETVGTADSSSAQAQASDTIVGGTNAKPSGTLTRDQAANVMTAIDELRKRYVREIKILTNALAKSPDVTKSIDLKQKQRHLSGLAELHEGVGEAFGLGGY